MKTKLLIAVALFITLAPALLLFLPVILNYDKSANNTEILGKNYSNLSRAEIVEKLNQDFVLPYDLKLQTANNTYSLNLASISAQLDTNKLAGSILYRRLNEGVMPYIKYFFAPKKFVLEISYDEPALDKYISDLSSQINKPFVPTELQYQNNTITVSQGEIGREVASDILKQDILSKLTLAEFNGSIDITFANSGYIPADGQIEETKLRAQKLIGKSLVLNTDTNNITVDDKTLISWLDFKDKYQKTKIDDYSKNIAQSLKRDPVNAVFKFENGKVLEFKPASNGIIPDETALSSIIKESLDKLTDSSEKTVKVAIPVKTVEPLVQNDEANNLGIKELLGRGVSTFKHSDSIRNANIEKGSSIVNRILVAPGETFSFIKNLGEVSLENGYKKAYIIRAGKTELDVGGGICQVSTTLFRAMLNSGLDIIDRKAHAYRVSYYEEDSKPGFDATVFIPSPDLKFINDTGHHVLIQNTFDLKNRTLIYEIYGTSDGRKVEISNYRQWDAQPAPPDIYIDDPTLPPGKVVQDEHRVPGLKTAFDWTVKNKEGKIIHQKTFQSNYTPWAAVYRRGIQN
jgi:vancomycin resistance protein YoaR